MKVLLHVCCGVCAAGVTEQLVAEGHEVIGLFYNPNIHPTEEYTRRLEVADRVAAAFGFPLTVPPYNPDEWFREAEMLASEPEGGKRCEVCFRLRLRKAYDYMMGQQIDVFTTTLTIGPRKSADIINRIGQEIGGDLFLSRDFKKKAGFQRAMELSKQWQLYRQDYCGCVYSIRSQ
ncbi:MAG: epoxyqueuosine reductase QueH [Dehalococcoidales bacterium]|nr:MAG: epoxyqueuosine reductase QueH [Dehalococcoidales bacterium]